MWAEDSDNLICVFLDVRREAGWQEMPGTCCIFAGSFALLVCTFSCLGSGSGLPVFFMPWLVIVGNVPLSSPLALEIE
jgi:hypothetical protein